MAGQCQPCIATARAASLGWPCHGQARPTLPKSTERRKKKKGKKEKDLFQKLLLFYFGNRKWFLFLFFYDGYQTCPKLHSIRRNHSWLDHYTFTSAYLLKSCINSPRIVHAAEPHTQQLLHIKLHQENDGRRRSRKWAHDGAQREKKGFLLRAASASSQVSDKPTWRSKRRVHKDRKFTFLVFPSCLSRGPVWRRVTRKQQISEREVVGLRCCSNVKT